ncbi:MAG: helix-turn-helix domain-containing protein [Lachnospiraceae bacterium]|nr:helix-turn-helix domain-containing protein [Lachnospiraceae bacterium]
MISYEPFFKTLVKRKISQYQLINDYLIPSGTLSRIRNNKSLTLKSIENICKALNCNISDVVSFI